MASKTTTFPSDENPISEGGDWVNGATTGVDWGDVKTVSGTAYGVSKPSPFSDPTAILTGTFANYQQAQATVYLATADATNAREVELRLRSSLSANVNSGYEFLFNTRTTSTVHEILRWDGAYGDFHQLGYSITGLYVSNGDVIKAIAAGRMLTMYVNDVPVCTAFDSTFTSGKPGIGFFADSGEFANIGFTDFSAQDLTDTLDYFGACDIDGFDTDTDSHDTTGGAVAVWNGSQTWTCPGSGSRTVKKLEALVSAQDGVTGHIRLAIFVGTTKVCAGTAEITIVGRGGESGVDGTPYTWQGHTDSDLTWYNGYTSLTGGTNYVLFMAADANVLMRAKAGSSGIAKYDVTDYTGTMPTTLPTGTANTYLQSIRVGLSPVSSYNPMRRLSVLLRMCLNAFSSLFGRIFR